MPDAITLPRTGDRPLSFDGEELASASSHSHDSGPLNARWHELAVYRTAAGKIVVAVGYRTRWQGELDHDAAALVDTPEEAVAHLRGLNPLEHLVGYPLGGQYAAKQARVERGVTSGYEHAVSEVLAALGPERIP